MNSHVGMKIAFLAAVILCIACSLFCTACSDKEKYIALDRGSLKAETWLEVEKNRMCKEKDAFLRVKHNLPVHS